MGKVYVGQSKLKIRCTLDQEITGCTESVIKYIKPDGTEDEFDATVEDYDTGIIYYDVQEGDLDMAGWWHFWGFITFSDGRDAPSDVAKVKVHVEGH